MIKKAAHDGVETVWDRLEKQTPQCGYGLTGFCCKNCMMGPCRLDPFGDGPTHGVCGADGDTIVARFLGRFISAGAAAHSDHGRDLVEVLHLVGEGKAPGYEITNEEKLKRLATEFGVKTDKKDPKTIARELGWEMMEEYGMRKKKLQLTNRAPKVRQDLWQKLNIMPRSIDRENVEMLHRTHMGVDNEYVSTLLHGLRTALSDGWGGSMLATEVSDILFGVPKPVESQVNLGVLKKDQVNIAVHGHNPMLSEMVVRAVRDPEMIKLAKQKGAKGINLVGLCCTGNELLMRKGVPMAGNHLMQELTIVTGALEGMIVDYQCIMPAVTEVAKCYHTKVISTSEKAHFKGAIHMEFKPETGEKVAKEIVRTAVENFPNRIPERVNIPVEPVRLMAGFSVEAILGALGGKPDPLIDAIKAGKVRGAAGVVGCNNPKIPQDYGHVNMVKELIKNDVLVVETGCAAVACGKAGLMTPEAADMAGKGLKEVCNALGIPPVLHMGSCVDNVRILVLASALANALGVDISQLPLAGAAPEWYSEKAVSIGAYVVGSGIYTVLGIQPPVVASRNVVDLLTNGLEKVVGATFAIEADPFKAAGLMVDHINAKRKALGLPV
ncbi:MAG: anaerobic carbon-monoxide dehydrogenase catalytic subunit [Calditrichia bacterium]